MQTSKTQLVFLLFSFQLMLQWRKIESSMEISCQRNCGDMEIPYPFGLSSGCFLEERFQLSCIEGRSSAALNWLQWEVNNISLSDHTFRHVNQSVQIFPFNASGESRSFLFTPVDSSNYSISPRKNRFLAMGCDFYAYVIDQETMEYQGGCASLCNRSNVVPFHSSVCSGLDCCEMNFLRDLNNLTVGVATMNTLSRSWVDQCGCFTFVEEEYLRHNKMNACTCNEGFVLPIIHEWAVGSTNCAQASGKPDYVCGPNTECVDYDPGKGYRCKCRSGYDGNPYLADGCEDIDECASSSFHNCPENRVCTNIAGSYFCSSNRRNMLALLIPLATGLPAALLLLVAIGFWTWRKLKMIKARKIKQKFFKKNGGILLQQQISSSGGRVLLELIHFAIDELEKATDNFNESRILGKGGLGTVYKGMLSDGRIIAVKKANIIDDSQVAQFINEVFILSQINHRHIVTLLGCCLETQVPLLVYEYISNGTLSNHLHNEPHCSAFSWFDRLRIATEVAEALSYLHSCASSAIFHRDIKSSNILLDENFKAVVSDFGLSKSVSIDKTHLTTSVGGTFGYLDPQYFRSGKLNDKSDVYAFGVVLAEILTGQKAVSEDDDVGLALTFRSAVKEDRLSDVLDQVVAYEGRKEEILAVAKLAKRCIKISAYKRPSMKEVAAELEQLRKAKEELGQSNVKLV